MGGIVKAISEGLIQREVARQAYLYERGIQSGEIVKVGVNKYRIEEEERDVELHEYRAGQADEKIRRLNKLRSERDGRQVTESLERLRQAAAGKGNLMPYIMDAVRAYATVGEMTQVLKDVFGEFREPVVL
jgi:methylmalonyl-CoA mutase N-terminal domain/subunit